MSLAIDILKQLIACPSVTPASAGSIEYLAERMQAADFHVQRLPMGDVDNLLAWKGDSVRLLFAGHVDVVPPGDLENWRTDPFIPVENDGYLFGRGAADMKSGVAAMTAAAIAAPLDGVALFMTTDEEGVALHGTRHFVEWWQQHDKPPIPCAIVGEPTCDRKFGDAIKIGRRGSLTARLRIIGKQTHAAYAFRGDNPAHRLADILHDIKNKWGDNITRQAAGEMVTTFQVVDMKSGVGADNVTPPFADTVFNFRNIVKDDAASLRTRCEAAFERHAAGVWQCKWVNSAEPFIMPQDSHLVAVLRECVKEETGMTAALTTSGGSSDARFLRHICTELAEFGVMNETIHAPNERVRIADVEKLAAVYMRLIHQLLA